MSQDPRKQQPEEGWPKVFEGDVWRARIVHTELEGRGVPAIVTEPQFYTPNPELNGVALGNSSVFVPPDRLAEAKRIVDRSD
jgi:hypothetical protein